MKGTTIAAAAALVCSAGVEGLQVNKRTDGSAPKVLHMPLMRREHDKPMMSNSLRKRNVVSSTLQNFQQGSLYFAQVTIGTPPQQFNFHVDTGSSDLWTNIQGSKLCAADKQIQNQGGVPCSVSGTYDNTSSSTARFVNNAFSISYADGTGAKGAFVSDTVRLGGVTIQNQQFGVGTQSSSSEGVMGIGFPALETAVQTANQQPYKNIPQQMVAQGLTNTAAYSLWLDDVFSSTGNILFGGIDTDKYVGKLSTLPIQKVGGQNLEMIVNLNGVSMNQNGGSAQVLSTKTPVLLDSGSTLTYLPVTAAKKIYSAVGAQFDPQQQIATVSCDLANSSQTLTFQFDNKDIQVKMSELVLQNQGGGGGFGQSNACTFGIVEQPATQDGPTPFTLGDSFIRNAYLVYDLDRSEISIAQSNTNSKKSTIMELSANNDGTGATGVAADEASPAATIAPWPASVLALLALFVSAMFA